MMRETLIYLSNSKRLARMMTSNRLARSAATRFVAGETIDEAIGVTKELNGAGMRVALDYLGEGVTSEEEARRTAQEYLDAIDRLEAAGVQAGGQTYVSLKLTSMGLDIADALAEAQVRRIVERAARVDPPLYVRVDMEGSPYTQRTLDVFHRVFADHKNVGIVIQSALYRSAEDVDKIVAVGAGVRLCKGAYAEPASIAYPAKADVDGAFLRLAERMLSAEARQNGTYLAVATHDEKIIDWAKRYATEHGIPKDSFEFQMLNGIRRDLWPKLVAEGYRMRVYVPYGTHWYPYYMRRMAERPENVGFMVRHVLHEIRG
jgi:proline dehydrogenase